MLLLMESALVHSPQVPPGVVRNGDNTLSIIPLNFHVVLADKKRGFPRVLRCLETNVEALAIRRLALEPFPLRPARSAQMVAFAVNDPRLTIRGEAAVQQYQQYWASSKF